jgi:hypothetical protein
MEGDGAALICVEDGSKVRLRERAPEPLALAIAARLSASPSGTADATDT